MRPDNVVPLRAFHLGPPASAAHPSSAPAVEPLWREVVGAELRARRHEQGRTLADVAERAGVSVQYLSEIERGLKDPSSEILGAVNGALGLRLADLTTGVGESLGRGSGPLCLVG